MLAVALSLSAIAAYYSIAGLAAIFAAAVIPIVVMGGILELAKITVTVWLHEYWPRVKWPMRLYLVPAVGLLMLITSMGIFGFLSKAHLDQAVPAGDISAQVSIYDEKIQTQKDNIETARRALKQMDSQVEQMLGRTTDDRGADRAVQIRRQQAKERARLQDEISQAQKKVVELQEQRAPKAAEARKVEAEVGPIKYVAALIYGDNPDANLLERAVRWIIIILVIVFDPLAIMMLLAATESLKWERETRTISWSMWRRQPHESQTPVSVDSPDKPPSQSAEVQPPNIVETAPDESVLQEPQNHMQHEVDDEDIDAQLDLHNDDDGIKEAMRAWKQANPGKTLKEQRSKLEHGLIDRLPWLDLQPDADNARESRTDFGTVFPTGPEKGDTFIRVDQLPNRLYKFNGQSWIETNKGLTDNYTYNDAYIDHLIGQIDRGEYDPDYLTESEAEQIAKRLGKSQQ